MKRIICLLLICCLTRFTSDAQMLQAVVGTNNSSGLILNMPLNEGGSVTKAIDTVAGNNGTWSGTKSCSGSYYYLYGGTQNVGCFDGSTNYITLTSNTGLNLTSNFTVMAWVFYDGTETSGTFPRIYSNLTGSPYNGYELILHDTTGVGVTANKLYFQVYNASTAKTAFANSTITANTWTCVAATYNGSTGTLYINGTAQTNTFSGSSAVGSSSVVPAIGYAAWDPTVTKWIGYIADVQVYNVVLSAAQITTACGSQP